MLARGISILISSSLDVGNIPAPRPYEALADACGRAAMRALQAPLRFMPPSERSQQPERWARIQRERREQLESFLWIEPNAAALERMIDLLDAICGEGRWAAGGGAFDDSTRPDIDLQAAETGMLLAWTLRRHGGKLLERDPRVFGALLGEVRRRLLAPLLAHEDYPFMLGEGRCPMLILSDLLMTCLLMEHSPSRRQQPVKLLLRLLDRLCGEERVEFAPYAERLADACALADLARLLKRLTRGELDLTGELPPEGMLDGVLIPWMAGNFFFDPTGSDMLPSISGMDVFRLGHLTRDRVLCALGAQLNRAEDRPAFSLSGRILSMEYMRAAQDEVSAPPKVRRAAADGGRLMLSRVDALTAAIAGAGARSNAGDVALFCGNKPILVDAGGDAHSLPLIDGFAPVAWVDSLPTDADFGDDRDLMSVDLTDAYPETCPLAAYQRTLITMQADGTVRLVDAFEFTQSLRELDFRFITAQRPQPLEDGIRLGMVDMSWDGEMLPEYTELPTSPAFPDGCWLLRLRLANPPKRLICGFTFEGNA